ncbi:MAG: plasmid pRiA4b ORF-3 family protein [Chloroflexi bacterium]|nr:plasmid pRiA4b ORF-3 family protein [Chloroflexota bacterium]
MAAKKVYQFKVTLKGIRPPIWRRFQVVDNITFYELHHILQEVMGWYNAHLHQFDLGGLILADAEILAEIWEDGVDEQKSRLNEFVGQEGQKLSYEYDFGDSWEHILLLEKILPTETNIHYPCCLKGKRACPPEDCGGVWGYAELLEALANKDHPEHETYLDWLGDDLDPEAFDLDGINGILQDM